MCAQALIKQKHPGRVYLLCVAHIMQLAIIDEKNNNKYSAEIEQILNIISLMYYQSPKLRDEFTILGEAFIELTRQFKEFLRSLNKLFASIY